MQRTYWYAAMTKDEVQHSRMTFYEAGSNSFLDKSYMIVYIGRNFLNSID
jgi:hypothetical protein